MRLSAFKPSLFLSLTFCNFCQSGVFAKLFIFKPAPMSTRQWNLSKFTPYCILKIVLSLDLLILRIKVATSYGNYVVESFPLPLVRQSSTFLLIK